MALEGAFDAEPGNALTPAQRAAVRRAADAQAGGWWARIPVRPAWGLGAAAVVTTAIVVTMIQLPRNQQTPQIQTATDRTGTASPNARTATGQTPATASNTATTPLASTAQPGSRTATALPGANAPALTIEMPPAIGAVAGTTMAGTVRDASGAALPGVTVTATNPSTGVATSTVTDASGRYTFAGIDSSQTYRLTATLAGFQSASADVAVGQLALADRDLTMRVGGLQETVTVSGQTPVVDTQSTKREVQIPSDGQPRARSLPPAVAAAPPPPPALGLTGSGRGGALGGVVGNGNTVGAISDRLERTRPSLGTESYARTNENGFVRVSQEPLATFSIDVDTASYSNVRRFLNQNQLPPADAVRIDELVNYFTYDYARPTGGRPIGASMTVTTAPWNPRNRLLRVGIRARDLDEGRRPLSNLVFLIDVSGSMATPQKLPLVKSGLKMLVDQLGENDVVSIVVYAGSSGLALPPTRGDRKDVIARALDSLEAGGSTNGASGIQLAYNQATANFIRGGVNRVILVTDGDFNVGITDQSQLTRLIEDRAKSGVFLSVLGFGMGNLKDSTMEKLADMGNGHYAYIDTLNEARKVLVEQMSGTLVTVAKDVKIQVDFNPAKVEAYRLIGYENRVLRPEDFNNDLKDAGDMGAGHTVTALFEIVPRGGTVPGASVDPSVFQPATRTASPPVSNSRDLLVLRMRYKLPDATESTRMDLPLADRDVKFSDADPDARFAAAVAAFGMILKDSPYRGNATFGWVLDTATTSEGHDRGGYRDEFVSLVRKAMALSTRGRRD
jgi:Ca-activated chloride channel family protein